MSIAQDMLDLSVELTAVAADLQAEAGLVAALEKPAVDKDAVVQRLLGIVGTLETAAQDIDDAAGDVAELEKPPVVVPPPEPPPEPPPTGDGPIAQALAQMAPGETRTVSTDTRFFTVAGASGTYWILDWTPRCHWHVASGQIIHFGVRQQHRAIAWRDNDGGWRDLPLPMEWQNNATFSGHWYGWSAMDPAGTIYAKNYRFDIAAEAYEALPAWPTYIDGKKVWVNGGNGTMCAWMGDRYARYGTDIQQFLVFDPVTQQWGPCIQRIGNGQHALMEWHPVVGKCLVVGGNNTAAVTHLIGKDGGISRVADFPAVASMSGGGWIIAHRSGAWIVRTDDARLFAYDATGDTWTLVGQAPDAGTVYPTIAYDAGQDAAVILHTKGMMVWRCPETFNGA